ncbi:hypothetical protein HZA56_21720 [Candidatus Poribacteria bacterium]|nr:hypothetical protein [Candidatus Poribacteria bacterium]
MPSVLEKEFEYYLKKQSELVERYNGKYIAIRHAEVVGVFDSEAEAVEKMSARYELGTFLIQKCEPGSESYTQTYHSRVVLS